MCLFILTALCIYLKIKTPLFARVVEWHTRTFEGRMGRPVRVQVSPRAPRADSSAEERLSYTQEATGSSPVPPTIVYNVLLRGCSAAV